MIGASVYTDRQAELHRGSSYGPAGVESGRFGYSYVLAWVAFAFTLLSDTSLVPEKKMANQELAGVFSTQRAGKIMPLKKNLGKAVPG
ncbi:hypothetical protein Chor_015381 [Crotalus horridus]